MDFNLDVLEENEKLGGCKQKSMKMDKKISNDSDDDECEEEYELEKKKSEKGRSSSKSKSESKSKLESTSDFESLKMNDIRTRGVVRLVDNQKLLRENFNEIVKLQEVNGSWKISKELLKIFDIDKK